MHLKLLLVFSFFALSTGLTYGQQVDTLVKKLDSLQKVEAKPENKPVNDIDKTDFTQQTNITPKAYFVLLGTDLVQEVTGPFHASKKTWIKAGEFALVEGALFFADETIQRNTVKFMGNNTNLTNLSTYITNFGGLYEAYTLAAFGAYGVIFKSNKVKTTTLLATQAYITGAAMETALKFLSGRQRPNAYDPNHPESEGIFHGPSISVGKDINGGALNSSFPSGHTTVAFAAATVFAQEYKDQTLIPIIAYAAATMVGVSRITENKHWATDVFAGAALGYVTGKQVVNNYHRYARLQNGKKKKTATYFNLDYRYGLIMPGLVCKF